jgi:hypothetical protein
MTLRKLGATMLATMTLAGASVFGLAGSASALDCSYGHLCGVADGAGGNGQSFDFYQCGTYPLPNLIGDGHFNNNQTPGTTAVFHKADGTSWSTTAPEQGTASWTPVQSVTVC